MSGADPMVVQATSARYGPLPTLGRWGWRCRCGADHRPSADRFADALAALAHDGRGVRDRREISLPL